MNSKPTLEQLESRDASASINLDFSGLGVIFTGKHRSLNFVKTRQHRQRIDGRDLAAAKREITKRVQAYFPAFDVKQGGVGDGFGAVFAGRPADGSTALGHPGKVYVEAAWDTLRGFLPAPQRFAQWLAQIAAHEIGHQMGISDHEDGTPMSSRIDVLNVYDWSDEQQGRIDRWT